MTYKSIDIFNVLGEAGQIGFSGAWMTGRFPPPAPRHQNVMKSSRDCQTRSK